MLDTHILQVLMIRPLFYACLLAFKMPLLLTTAQSTSGDAVFCTASLFKYRFHLCLAWKNTEYFEILNDKWRIFCMLLNFKISFTEHIIKACVMLYNFVHKTEYCNSDPILSEWIIHHTSWGSDMAHKLYEQYLRSFCK